jgi:glycolate oxidase FAD binding subunit
MVQDILRSTIVPAALEYSWSRTHSTLAVLLEGVEAGVEAQQELAATVMDRHGGRLARSEGARESEKTATPCTPTAEPDAAAVGLKVGHVLSDLPAVIRTVQQATRKSALSAEVYGHAASGISTVVVSPTGIDKGPEAARDEQLATIREIRGSIAARGGSVVVREAPLWVKQAIDVWGDTDSALPLMRRVKERFDPNRIMNPGRFIGGI